MPQAVRQQASFVLETSSRRGESRRALDGWNFSGRDDKPEVVTMHTTHHALQLPEDVGASGKHITHYAFLNKH